jgi:zinc transport system substrate-binding protein
MFPILARHAWIRLLLPAFLGSGGCRGSAPADDRPAVAVSVPPQADLVRRLAGDRVRVHVLVPPSIDPHTYEPAVRQMRFLSEADLLIRVGHPGLVFETLWLERLLSERPGLPLVEGPRTETSGDPHPWVTPRWMAAHAGRIAPALAALLPEEAAHILDNRDRLLLEIDRLDAEIRATLADCRGDTFFVFHAAWERFAEEYGLVQVSIQEHDQEPSADHVAYVLETARRARARAIFVQPQYSRRSADLVAAEIGARVVVLDPLAEDWMAAARRTAAALREALAP